MAQRSKNHHFVPKVLQQRFIREGKRIWYSERGEDDSFGSPELRNIGKTFRKRNYYTVLNGEEQSDIVEREFYGKIDDYLGKLLPDILNSFERKEIPTFSGESLDSLRKVVMEMAKRTPEFIKDHDDLSVGREIVESTLEALPEKSESEERLQLLSDINDQVRLREYGRDARVRGVVERSEKIEEALEEFSVRWAVSETHHSFILSSMIAYRIGNGGPNGLSNPNMEIWMPIAPKIALVLLRDPNNKIPLKSSETSIHIRKVNEYAVRNSQQIASHSNKLLESLTGKRVKGNLNK